MSWIVANTLTNRTNIRYKSNHHEKEYRNFNFFHNYDASSYDDADSRISFGAKDDDVEFLMEFGYDDPHIENDEFNDLLVIEKAIDDLVEKGLLTKKEVSLLESVYDGQFVSTRTRRNRKTFSKNFKRICQRIAFYLGGYFTDEGYLDYIQDKYKLTDEQTEQLEKFIISKSKNRITRRFNVKEQQ